MKRCGAGLSTPRAIGLGRVVMTGAVDLLSAAIRSLDCCVFWLSGGVEIRTIRLRKDAVSSLASTIEGRG